jgi:ABC-type antimicrobial peptide transport system permease subunit
MCPPEALEEVEGDLLELYGYWVETFGVTEARRRYVISAIRLQRPFLPLLKKIRSRPLNAKEMIHHYLITAFRNVVRAKSFSIINITGLAFGLGCSLLIFLWVLDELSYDKFHSNNSTLYRVYLRELYDGRVEADFNTPAALPAELKESIPEIEYATGFVKYFRLSLQDDIYESFSAGDTVVHKMKGSRAEPDFFSMFSYELLYGKPTTALSDPVSLCVSRKMAEIFCGSAEAAMGKTLRFDGRKDVLITGVFENVPAHSSDQFDYLMNWDAWVLENPLKQNWGHFGTSSYIRLRADADPQAVEAKIKDFLKPYLAENASWMSTNKTVELGLQPFADQYLCSTFENGKPVTGRILHVKLFIGVGGFILLIACINFVNLATARSTKRAKEVGVRKVIGSSRNHLIFQFMGEAVVLTILAVLLSLLAVVTVLPAFNLLTGKQIVLPLQEPFFLGFLVGLIVLTGIVAGSYPALFLSSLKPVNILKGGFQFSLRTANFRKSLVVFQFILSMLLLISTVVISRQTEYLQNKNLGYDRENVIYIPVEGDLIARYDVFREQASRLPGVKIVDRSSQFPHAMSFKLDAINWEGRDPNTVVNFAISSVGYDFDKLMNLEVVDGRGFDRYNKTDSLALLVNQEAVRQMGLQDPIGAQIAVFGKNGTIVGVLRDYHTNTLHQAIDPLVLDVKEELNFGTILVRTESGKTKVALEGLEKLYKQMNPAHAFNYTFMDERYGQLYKSEQVVNKLSNVFAVLGIAISCMGLLGLSMFSAEQRRKELSIRKVLGASVSGIVMKFSKDFLRLVVLALVIAVPIAWVMMETWLQRFAYRIDLSWWMFAMAGVIAILLSILTIGVQAVKSALENPVKNLRSE